MSNIGKHKLGTMFKNARAALTAIPRSMYGAKFQELAQVQPYNVDGITSAHVPHAPVNPYRKRPVKLVYDKNEYHEFMLPSEKAFLLGSFSSEDVFGERKGILHSPHIRS